MNNYFKYETELVDKFIDLKFNSSSKSITTIEVPVRWGNIDIVNIKNNYIPFSDEQCVFLTRVSNARIFLKTKKNKGISKNSLLNIPGMSVNTIENCISQLLKAKLIIKKDNLYYRNIDFSFPKVTISGYEAKLTDYKKAFFQAMINKEYVDYSYIVFPLDIANKIFEKYSGVLIDNGIGLIGVSNKKQKLLIKPKRVKEVKQYYRLVNIVQANLCLLKKASI